MLRFYYFDMFLFIRLDRHILDSNMAATLYLRVHASSLKDIPSIKECYVNGYRIKSKLYQTQIVTYSLIIIGLVLLVIPGVIMAKRYIMAPYYAVEHPDLSVKQILNKAREQTRPYASSVLSTAFFVLSFSLIASLLLSNSTIGMVIYYITTYAILYIMPFRYQELFQC